MLENQTILYYLPSGKISKAGLATIYCRLTINGSRVSFSTKKLVHPKKWDTINQRVFNVHDDSRIINPYLNLLTNKIYESQFKLESLNMKISAAAIKQMLSGEQDKNSKSLFRIFEEHNNKMKSLINLEYVEGTAKRYCTTLKHLKEFVEFKYKQKDFKVKDVSHEFIHEFDYYMRHKRKCCNNTAVKYTKNFRKIIKLALANSWIDKDPFVNYKMKIHKVDRGYLTTQELNLLNNKRFHVKRIEQVKDVFLFQCYTGLAYCDTFNLTKKNLVTDDTGIVWIKTARIKTGSPVNVPLLPRASEILDKYKSHSRTDESNCILPVLSNQKMNAYLKEIADLCGIEKRLSCHLARHTFATTVTLANGISLESVSKMLGHTNLNTTKIYARMLDSRVLQEMQVLSKKLQEEG
jgi:site-specific recombinase XerD